MSASEPAPGRPEILRITAPNPGPMTLEGTNTYLVGTDPCWVIDPGPEDDGHLLAITTAAEHRGGIAGVLLTHSHLDHSAGVGPLLALGAELLWEAAAPRDEGAELAAALEEAEIEPVGLAEPAPETTVGPFTVVPTPGHAADHVCFVWDDEGKSGRPVCFCGDLVLGSGSSIVPPRAAGGSLADYLASLDRLEALDAALLAPGHGPWITDPAARIGEYRDHRLERERALLAALREGERSRQALLELAWSDVPAPMRPVAALAMQAHLEKLAGEGFEPGPLVP